MNRRSTVEQFHRYEPVEPDTAAVLGAWRVRGIRVVGLTDRWPEMDETTRHGLAIAGIELPEIVYARCEGACKAVALGQFFEQHPEIAGQGRWMFVDDSLTNLQNVRAAYPSMEAIQYLGVQPNVDRTITDITQGLAHEPSWHVWRERFDAVRRLAEEYPKDFEWSAVGFVRNADVDHVLLIPVPRRLSAEGQQIFARYIAGVVNNYLVSVGAHGVRVRSSLAALVNEEIAARYPQLDELLKDYYLGYWEGVRQVDDFSIGGPARRLQPSPRRIRPIGRVIGLNIGQSDLKMVVLDSGQVVAGSQRLLPQWRGSPAQAGREIDQIAQAIETLQAEFFDASHPLRAIGIAVPGVLRHHRIVTKSALGLAMAEEQFQAFQRMDVLLQERFGVPVVLEQDVRSRAVALSQQDGIRDAFLIDLGTSLGGAWIDAEGRVPDDVNQVGRMVAEMSADAVWRDDRKAQGVQSLYLSARGLERLARASQLSGASPADVAALSRQQDPGAIAVLRTLGVRLGQLLDELSGLYPISRAIVSGGLMQADRQGIIVTAASEWLRGRHLPDVSVDADPLEARFGGAIGAAWVAYEALERQAEPQLSFSILGASEARVLQEVAQAEEAGADALHIDVIDGRFTAGVEPFDGISRLRQLRSYTRLPVEIHLMVEEPDAGLIRGLLESGFVERQDYLYAHYESFRTPEDLRAFVGQVKSRGVQFGLVLNPGTPVSVFASVSDLVDRQFDRVVLMSVIPGASGRPFVPQTMDKLDQLSRALKARRLPAKIVLDGGLTPALVAQAHRQGASHMVVRTAVVTAEDVVRGFERLKGRSSLQQNLDARVVRDPDHLRIVATLLDMNQGQLFARWELPGHHDDRKRAFLGQLVEMDRGYPGGLRAYQANAKKLIEDSARGQNPFEGETPEVPDGVQLTQMDESLLQFEQEGLLAANRLAFVLVAGGLGERLGYDGIKLAIPLTLVTSSAYLEWYIASILALQEKSNRLTGESRKIPLVIMTSDETHDNTLELLRRHDNFGLASDQLIILRQGLVPAMRDNTGAFVLSDEDPYRLESKPHGHGDMHRLLYRHGLVDAWVAEGRTHTVFIQDTNGQVFNGILPALGVSRARGFEFNFMTVPREAKEQAGVIIRRRRHDGTSITGNVEYNLLDPFLRATINPQGDAPDPTTGLSVYPGNTNAFIIRNDAYQRILRDTRGLVQEFVNPKYADATRTTFTSPARLETMMQDAALWFSTVGATHFEKRHVFSPVKNNLVTGARNPANGLYPDAMPTGEADFHKHFRRLLQRAGVQINVEGNPATARGVPYQAGAKVVLRPRFAQTVREIIEKIKGGSITDRSTLIIDGEHVVLENLQLDGALIIRTAPDVTLTIRNATVTNAGWHFVELTDEEMRDPTVSSELKVRGYRLDKRGERVIELSEPGDYELSMDGVLRPTTQTQRQARVEQQLRIAPAQAKSPAPMALMTILLGGGWLGLALLGMDLSWWPSGLLGGSTTAFGLWTIVEMIRHSRAMRLGRTVTKEEFAVRLAAAVEQGLLPADTCLACIKPVSRGEALPPGERLRPFQAAKQIGAETYVRVELAYSTPELARVIRHELSHKAHPIHGPPAVVWPLVWLAS
ncbi:MAG TPA: hypothetical protein DDX89_05190, partial [Candidatus Omnitrophica bacterium]|nr:hypothetical protein [Candidatus Omnitrophota bacterium]